MAVACKCTTKERSEDLQNSWTPWCIHITVLDSIFSLKCNKNESAMIKGCSYMFAISTCVHS